jgi:ADP-heptose:LPS heptosyltransferase
MQRLALSWLGRFWRPHALPQTPKRVVILEMTRLGDVVAATALIDALALAYPGAALEFVAQEPYAPLFAGDERVVFSGLPGSNLSFLRGAWRLRGRLRGADLALFSASPSARNSFLCWLSRPGLACGFLFPRAGGLGYDEAQRLDYAHGTERRRGSSDKADHLVTRCAKVLALGGIPAKAFSPRLLSPAARVPGRALLHAGANWAWRRWPLENFLELEKKLKERGWEVRLILPHESLELVELRDLLAAASLFVGNDSGPLHLAASLGTPCVGLFGPNLASRSGPWPLERHKVLFEPVPCSPCAQTVCVQPSDWCMAKLRVERVLQAI